MWSSQPIFSIDIVFTDLHLLIFLKRMCAEGGGLSLVGNIYQKFANHREKVNSFALVIRLPNLKPIMFVM